MPPKTGKPKSDIASQKRITRSNSNNRADDQPSIIETLKMAEGKDPKESVLTKSTPATGEDIKLILQKLNDMDTDIKCQFHNIEVAFQNKLDKVEKKLTDMYNSVKLETENNKTDIEHLKETVTKVEESQTFQSDQMLDLSNEFNKKMKELQSKHDAREKALKESIQSLENKMLDMEKHGRKYSLLFYGVEEKPKENMYGVVKSTLIDDFKLPKEEVDDMVFANAHRLPTRGSGHRPIIVKFVRFADRDRVLGQAFSGVLPKGKRVLTDLPPKMKEERYKLEKRAYDLRQSPQKFKTRIVEKGIKLELQIKKAGAENWGKAPE